MVTVLDAHEPVTPAGNPANVAPVAPVVVMVILVMAVFIHTVRFEPAVIVFNSVTVIVPVAVPVLSPPVKVTV